MWCGRCRGLMVWDRLMDLQDDTGQMTRPAWRCVVCGEIVDRQILIHRAARPAPRRRMRRRRLVLCVGGGR